MSIKYGVVGLSKGNGHPFSWSIACNGFSQKNLNKIPFFRIRHYLPKYNLKFCRVNDAEVTHVWTQNYNYSKLISKACNIKNICKTLDELASSVDAILFLRDDIEFREKYLIKLIKKGKPIYVDKYLHYDIKKVKSLLRLQKFDGQIFTESPLVNNKKMILSQEEQEKIGKIKLINSTVSGSWTKYGIHIIEPILRYVKEKKINTTSLNKFRDITSLSIKWEDGLITNFNTVDGSLFKSSSEFIGSKSNKRIIWDLDYTFDDFFSTIRKFTYIVKNKSFKNNNNNNLLIAKIIQTGLNKNYKNV